MSLADQVLAGEARAIARAVSLIENDSPEAPALMSGIYRASGRASIIGVTGAPGAGKSTLVDRLVGVFRAAGRTVGVVAVDPSSPFTGGAILGDRVRMQTHAEDAGVFIRSMATRGQLGGLARATSDAATVLDAAGFAVVLIETVGVGQAEVDIVRLADVSLVVVAPGAGDDVQALKAGIMEIGDVFVVNKADREGADRTAAAIDNVLSLQSWPADAWRPPVLHTVATTGQGVPAVIQAIERFTRQAAANGAARRRARAEVQLRESLIHGFLQTVDKRLVATGEFRRLVDAIADRTLDPQAAAARGLSGDGDGRDALHRPPSPSPLSPLDHVGIAVEDAETLATMLKDLFGFGTDRPEEVGPHRIRFVETGEATVELVEPLSPESPIARFIAKRGPGLHHLCFRVRDIDAVLQALKTRGVRLVDDVAKRGAHGARIAFLHPQSTGGILIEIKQNA